MGDPKDWVASAKMSGFFVFSLADVLEFIRKTQNFLV